MRKLFALIMLLGVQTQVFADAKICVKNFVFNGVDLCQHSPRHTYVQSEERPNRKLCTMSYPDERCKFNKQEFAHAKTPDGKIVCVLNFNQPSITGNYCAQSPDQYVYALDPWL